MSVRSPVRTTTIGLVERLSIHTHKRARYVLPHPSPFTTRVELKAYDLQLSDEDVQEKYDVLSSQPQLAAGLFL
jgi:hypothetical protein